MRLDKIKSNPWNFSFFMHTILKTLEKETLNSLCKFFPDSVKSKCYKDLLLELKTDNKEKKIEIALNLLENIYDIFTNKINEIKKIKIKLFVIYLLI